MVVEADVFIVDWTCENEGPLEVGGIPSASLGVLMGVADIGDLVVSGLEVKDGLLVVPGIFTDVGIDKMVVDGLIVTVLLCCSV